tara:strand:+ start:1329 stop:1895 length:567 start_codon:yes stop_codon:yes gene_type:complete
MDEKILIYTQHYQNSLVEVHVNEDKTIVSQVKCQHGDKCSNYDFTFSEYISKKMVGYRLVKKMMIKTNYIIDIDGTICDDIPNEQFELMKTARPHLNAIETINRWYGDGHNITFLTSRTEEHREVTEQWMRDNDVRYHGIMFGKPRIDGEITEYHYIDNHKIRATRYKEDSRWGDMVSKNVTAKVFEV